MKAELLLYEPHQLARDAFVELRIWRVPEPARGSGHDLKYALALVVAGECVLRYDKEAGKGDHRHVGSAEMDYQFIGAERLLADFWNDVDDWRRR